MKRVIFSIALIASNLVFAKIFPPIQTLEEIQSELSFLTALTDQVGFTYRGTMGSLDGLILPLSYYSTPDYWGAYVGALPGRSLDVIDRYDPQNETLMPTIDSPGRDLQIERVKAYYGTDIYDAACWQLGLALCGRAGMKGAEEANPFLLAENQNEVLYAGYDGNALKIHAGTNRAKTLRNGKYTYNGVAIREANKAYFFQVVGRNELSEDPLRGTAYMQHIHALNLPPNSQYKPGKMTWPDWNPLTRGNAWAFFIGPLQAAYLKQKSLGATFVPFSSLPVQNALNTLVALKTMQSKLGAIYSACTGSTGNEAGVGRYEVSIESNFAVLASLLIFEKILKDELSFDNTITFDQVQQIQSTLQDIDVMLYGGVTIQGFRTIGLFSFLKNYAWEPRSGSFYTGGEVNNPQQEDEWVPQVTFRSVDASTSAVAVLGQYFIDTWYGFGSAYQLWQDVKQWGGYYGPDGLLWGVGYSDQDGNGIDGNYKKGVLSAEQTAGAINMVRCLIHQYTAVFEDPKCFAPQRNQAWIFAKNLQKDHDSMYQKLLTLRTDRYSFTDAYSSVRPAYYNDLMPIPEDKLAFIDANKRAMISTVGIVNPLPNIAATSWALMLHFNFNPYKIGGDYSHYPLGMGYLSDERYEILFMSLNHVIPGCDTPEYKRKNPVLY